MAASDTNPLRLHAGPVAEGQAIRLGEIGGLLATVAISALLIETGVALAILPSVLAAGYEWGEAIWYSVYYSAMSFTNTGVTPNIEGLAPFAHDYWFLFMLMFGVTLGSIGFPVLYALSRNFARRARWSLHVKLTIVAWSLLWVLGTLAFLLLEQSNGATFRNMNPGEQIFQSGFMSTMARSGGFALIPTSELDSASLFFTDILMFIGGGSASTAGGIKVTTIAVLLLAAFAEARGRSSIEIFQRRIPGDVLRLAVSVLLWGSLTVGGATIVLLALTDAPFEFVLFDVISGFGTVGLSTGVTAELPDAGVYIMALVMFMGRVGTVTLAAALAVTQKGQLFTRPEERPIVG
jgi:Trk-type K+ transport system membrane component